MTDKVLFTFWEPRESVIPYLALCRQTWEKNLPDYSVVVLDYSNLDSYLGSDVYDIPLLSRLPLPMQKDAISVAVMKEHGGVFMDLDTLVLRDLDPIVHMLEKTQLVMFGSHMAFLAARPNTYALTLWLERIRENLAGLDARANVPWDYLGNSPLVTMMDEIVNRSSLNRAQTKVIHRLEKFSTQSGWPPGPTRLVNWMCEGFLRRRKEFAFDTVYRKYLTSLDRKKYSYILEAREYEGQHLGPEVQYLKYWFESDRDPGAVLDSNPILVGLHNSWTPTWYKNLSEKEVLENRCPLSRTLVRILSSSSS